MEFLHPPMLAREGCEREDIAREALWCGAISARDAFRSSLRISIVRWRARIHSFGCDSQRRIRCECEGRECAAVMIEVEIMEREVAVVQRRVVGSEIYGETRGSKTRRRGQMKRKIRRRKCCGGLCDEPYPLVPGNTTMPVVVHPRRDSTAIR